MQSPEIDHHYTRMTDRHTHTGTRKSVAGREGGGRGLVTNSLIVELLKIRLIIIMVISVVPYFTDMGEHTVLYEIYKYDMGEHTVLYEIYKYVCRTI